MSIIHEALKKVQSNRSETQSDKDTLTPPVKIQSRPAAPLPKPAPTPTTVVARKPFTYNIFVWCFLILAISAVTFYNLYDFTVRTAGMSKTNFASTSIQPFPSQPSHTPNTPATQTITPQIPAPIVPQPLQPQKGEILLTGIVFMDGKNFALINNEFYETGEMVEDGTITKITTDSVDITQNGLPRTIKVLRPK
ncbi:MAG: hypothetical protein H6754_08550 [Candidatus Omnitrophica bacterium]|nr:hypothetical protein [Candidatus Omnitrophota bacterium]